MILNVWLNGKKISEEISADTLLIDFVRKHGCSSVKRGCDTSNCGLCTLFVEDKPVLSCSMLAARVDGKHITTLEGFQKKLVNLVLSLPIKVQNNAVFAIQVSS